MNRCSPPPSWASSLRWPVSFGARGCAIGDHERGVVGRRAVLVEVGDHVLHGDAPRPSATRSTRSAPQPSRRRSREASRSRSRPAYARRSRPSSPGTGRGSPTSPVASKPASRSTESARSRRTWAAHAPTAHRSPSHAAGGSGGSRGVSPATARSSPSCASSSRRRRPPSVSLATTRISVNRAALIPCRHRPRARGAGTSAPSRKTAWTAPGTPYSYEPADDRRQRVEVEDRRRRGGGRPALERQPAPTGWRPRAAATPADDHVVDEDQRRDRAPSSRRRSQVPRRELQGVVGDAPRHSLDADDCIARRSG